MSGSASAASRRWTQAPLPGPGALVLVLTAAVFGAYGVALLVPPETLSDFWPWEVDAFHGRLYSAIFIIVAVATLGIGWVASPTESLLVGLTFLAGGAFTILGLVIVDGSEDTVDWAALGTCGSGPERSRSCSSSAWR
jgi:hypothetical protein